MSRRLTIKSSQDVLGIRVFLITNRKRRILLGAMGQSFAFPRMNSYLSPAHKASNKPDPESAMID